MSITLEATAIIVLFFVLSLIGAYVVLQVLKGTAIIKRKDLQLGGSAAMFVVMFVLLNHYFPEIHGLSASAAQAAQPVVTKDKEGQSLVYEVSVSPASQFVDQRELDALDRNRFVIDENLGIAIRKPTGDQWEVGEFEGFEIISITDIPAIELSVSTAAGLFPQISPTVFGVRDKKGHEISLTKSSKIASLPVTYNIYGDPDFVVASMKAQMELMSKLGLAPPSDVPDELIRQLAPALAATVKTYIEETYRKEKTVRNGVFAAFFTLDQLKASIFAKFSPESSYLDLALNTVFISGPMSGAMALGGIQNLYVNQGDKLASFRFMIGLKDVEIDGNIQDARLNLAGFIVAGHTRVVVVQIVFLDIDGVATFEAIKGFLDSLRFVG
jgi:hypothetical protein